MAEGDRLTEAQRMVRDMAADFCRREVAPRAAETDAGRFPAETIAAMGALGLLAITLPTEVGGGGADAVAAALAMEELAAACPSTSAIVAAHSSLVCEPVLRFGSDAQRRALLPGLASGARLGCFALTEPGAGSDAAAIATTAARAGRGWRVEGAKRFITNGREAGLCLLFAVTEKGAGHRGISAFLAESRARGYAVVRSEEKMGLGGSSLAELRFEGMALPAGALLGAEGQGFEIAMQTLDAGRIQVAAQGVGFARACLEASLAHARERVAFGRPLSDHQPVQWKLADMAVRVEGARLLCHRAARLKAAGAPYAAEAAMAKVFATDAARWASDEAVQIHGGSGYVRESPVERFYRAAKVTQIYEGTNEILRQVVAKHLLE